MCGIAGILNLNKKAVDKKSLIDVMVSIKHRGPDEDGIFLEGPVGLCNTRLKILELSKTGSQPMVSHNNQFIIVFNGEIYNYRELKDQFLSNVSFSGLSDTEVLLQMYIKYGNDCLKYLNGMFSFSIWDKKNNILFCARDRIGIKPLYYYFNNSIFIFGSEIKCILKAGIKAEPDFQSISDYLVYGYYEHTNNTFFNNIKSLEPGHYLTLSLSDSKLEKKRYWNLADESAKISYTNEKEFFEDYESLLFDSINLRLRSDVPIGINVSGGLDSCLISVGVQKVTKGKEKFPLFCYGGNEKNLNEFLYAERLANSVGWDLNRFLLHPEQVPQLAEEVILIEEQPYPGVISMAKHNSFRKLKNTDIKVILSGHGGDETAGGYRYFMGAFILDYVSKFGYLKAQEEVIKFLKREERSNIDTGTFLLQSLNALFHGQATSDGQPFVFLQGIQKDFLRDQDGHNFEFEKPFSDFSLNMQYQDLRYTKVPRILHNVDRASMAVGIEKRVPILDHRLVELSFSSPIEFRLKNGNQRYFMREVAKRILPHDLMKMPKRHSMDPQRYWFQTKLSNWVEEIFNSKSFKERGIFEQHELIKEFDEYQQQENPPTSYHIWQYVCLELWFRAFID